MTRRGAGPASGKTVVYYQGSIEEALASGEYDQGDVCVVTYDELADLAEQGKAIAQLFKDCVRSDGQHSAIISQFERRWNRPLHPVLGGKSPYTEFLPL